MITPTYSKELKFFKDYRFIAGLDEVGRAPLAGPVVAAAVILDPQKIGTYRSKTKWWQGLRDSKTLSAGRREELAAAIRASARDIGIGWASHNEIDELNIHYASLAAMRRALENMKIPADMLLLDGRFTMPGLAIQQTAIIDGDAHVLSIAAASIIAKVYRDALMTNLSKKFPEYGFAAHKGYDTSFHRNALRQYGPCEIHRMSFAPVREAMNERFRELVKV
jgi:ribonuclease HII